MLKGKRENVPSFSKTRLPFCNALESLTLTAEHCIKLIRATGDYVIGWASVTPDTTMSVIIMSASESRGVPDVKARVRSSRSP